MGESPRVTALDAAAEAKLGGENPALGARVFDLFIVVLLPIAVPALALQVASRQFFRLQDLALGFVALAVACMARAVDSRNPAWRPVSGMAILTLACEIVLAATADASAHENLLLDMIRELPRGTKIDGDLYVQIHDQVLSIDGYIAAPWQWVVSLIFGITLAGWASVLIMREGK